MLEMPTINRKSVIDQSYVAIFLNEVVHLWAASNAQAKQRAIEHYRPKKKQLPELMVMTKREYTEIAKAKL